MTVNHWATQAERDAFFITLKEKGAEALLEQLRRAKRVGSLRTPSTVGWDIRLALEETRRRRPARHAAHRPADRVQ